jgi:hypothetical protein
MLPILQMAKRINDIPMPKTIIGINLSNTGKTKPVIENPNTIDKKQYIRESGT